MIKKFRLLLTILVALSGMLLTFLLPVNTILMPMASAAANGSGGDTICFTVNPNPAVPGEPTYFDATGSYIMNRDIVKYEWNFGDGASGTGVTITHTYSQAGTYCVTLKVTDNIGASEQVASNVTCSCLCGPVADPGGPYSTYIGSPTGLTLNASKSFCPNQNYGNSIVKYEWDLDGDGDFNDASTAMPTIAWADLADLMSKRIDSTNHVISYITDPLTGYPKIPITLRVTDSAGKTSVASTTLAIYNAKPIPVPHWGPNPVVPIAADGTATVSLDGSASFDGDPTRHIVDWSWGVKGGNERIHGQTAQLKVNLGTLPSPIPEWGIVKTLTLSVSDEQGQTIGADFDVTFNRLPSQPPVIRFNVDREGVYIERGEGFSINTAQTTDPDGDWIRSTAWDVNNDGTNDITWTRTDTNGDGKVDGSDAGPEYGLTMSWQQMSAYPGFQQSGQHLIKFTVTDSTGATASDTVPLNIFDKALDARATALPAGGSPLTEFTFDGSQSRHYFPGQSITNWAWDFNNDGVYDASGATVSHTFASFGTFPVTMKVSDAAGHLNTDTVTVSVSDGNHAPIPYAGGPYSVNLGSGIMLNSSGSFDPDVNYGDSIQSYQWDIDQDGLYSDASGAAPNLPAAQISTLGPGIHRLALKVADSFGATGTAYTTLDIKKRNNPPVADNQTVITAENSPVNITLIASDPDGDQLSYSITNGPANGILSGTAPNLVYTPSSGFIGSDSFIFTVNDGQGGTASATVIINVTAINNPPVAEAGPNQTVEQSNPGGALVILDGSGSKDDGQKEPLTYTWTWNSGTASGLNPQVSLPPGKTIVTLTVNDGELSSTDTVFIFVVDTTPPSITLPANTTVEQTSPVGAPSSALVAPVVSDSADPYLTVTNNAPTTLMPGITNVTWTAMDHSGNLAKATQKVVVMDTTPPSISAPPDISIEQTSPDGATIASLGTPVVSDAVDPSPLVSNNAPAIFPMGITTVTWTATDVAGNRATAKQTVTVNKKATTPPPKVTLSNTVLFNTSDKTYVNMGIMATFSNLTGNTIIDKGFITIKNPGSNPGTGLTFDTPRVTTISVSDTDSQGRVIRAIKTEYGNTFYVRGYVKYNDPNTGAATTVYSDNVVMAFKNN